MRKRNYIKISTRAEIVYCLAKESLKEIIDMKIDYNDNDREISCNGFQNPTWVDIIYLVIERENIGNNDKIQNAARQYVASQQYVLTKNLRTIEIIVTNVNQGLIAAAFQKKQKIKNEMY